MKFSELAAYFERLESISSRIELTNILSELLKKVSNEEIDKVAYLLQGRVVPFFDPTEIGMADKMVEQTLSKAYGVSRDEVDKLATFTGDMGLASERLNEKLKIKNAKLLITDIHSGLYKIATTGGEGSVEKKINTLADMLSKLDSKSAKHLVRITLSKLRLGIGDPTVLDALSVAKTGGKTDRKDLEEAYNKTSDLGFVAQTYWSKGLGAVKKVQLQVGKPLRPALAERLPTAEAMVKRMGSEFAVEPKYDGFRCISGYSPLYIKGRGLMSARYVKAGDEVLTHKGVFKKIIATNKRPIDKNEKLFKLQSFLGNEIKITEKHRVLVTRSGKEQWVNVEEIKHNDYFVFPTPKLESTIKMTNPHLTLSSLSGYSKRISLDKSFYRFIGFWIGDGFTNEFHNTQRIGLTFNAKKEKRLAQNYVKLVKEKFSIANVSENLHNGGLNIYWRDEPFKDWLNKHFRREWKGKMIPEWFINISKENFESFLQGWIESDGTPRHGGGFKITTKESDLAALAQLISLKFGRALGLRRIRIAGKTYFEIIIPGTGRNVVFENGKLKARILHLEEIKNRDPRTVVYNFQVEGDETYCSSLIVLHNCQIHKDSSQTEIFSRNLENMTHMFPDIIAAVKKEVKARSAIFEGEAIAYNPVTEEFLPFQETTRRRRKYGVEEFAAKLPLKLFAFDLLYLNGKDITSLSYKERRKKLSQIVSQEGDILVAKEETLSSAQELKKMFEEQIAAGLEGVMVKKLEAPYKAGNRGFHWVKFKRTAAGELSDTIDCVLLGIYTGTGKRTQFGVGGLLVGVYNKEKDEFVSVSRIGTGLTDDEFRKVNEIAQKIKVDKKPARVNSLINPSYWVEPKEVLEIFADEITRSPVHTAGKKGDEPGYALRFPRLVSFRGGDKRAEDATTVKELIKMYNQQRKVKVR